MIKETVEIFLLYPILGGIALLATIILTILFRKQLKTIILAKLKLPGNLFSKKISIKCFVDDIKHVYVFKEHLVIDNYDNMLKCISRHVSMERKNGELLILDLSQVRQINDEAEEVLRETIRDTIINNNVRCIIIFPKQELGKLYTEMQELIKEKTCKSVYIKKDEWRKPRVNFV